MKIQILVFTSLVLLASTQAFAMPNWDGSYSCMVKSVPASAPGPVSLTLTTRDEKLYITGLSTGQAQQDGLPCATQNVSMNNGGAAMTMNFKCTATELDYYIAAKQPAAGTDMAVTMKFAQVSANAVSIYIKTAGKAQGKIINTEVSLACQK